MTMAGLAAVFLGINGRSRTVFASELSLYAYGFDLDSHAAGRLHIRRY